MPQEIKEYCEQALEPEYSGPRLYILLQPEEKYFSLPRVKTVWQLLKKLALPEESALVIRNGTLLTPDLHLQANDEIIVRKVSSRG
ncbi:MAG: hypothetical protein K5657_03085 [Desulfovibrio sp.]|nr:hypothetical protein [Desulfovibrio sp.]